MFLENSNFIMMCYITFIYFDVAIENFSLAVMQLLRILDLLWYS